MAEALLRAPLALLPVLLFLLALLYLDSYKLVAVRAVLAAVLLGAVAAGVSYLLNATLLAEIAVGQTAYSRYIAPLLEELLKALILAYYLRRHRIGFLVDAAIFGFAVGTGFATIENLYYLRLLPDAQPVVWIVRGFGTAIMHGGATAMFAIASQALLERRGSDSIWALLPGLLLAVVVHSTFNHFFLSPVLSTLGILLLLPPLIYAVFRQSERAVEHWLGVGFDADAELLELLDSGELSTSPVGTYLQSLREKFRGEVVADLLCYLRLHVELALRAKGLLMMRESGFDVGIGAETRAKLVEMDYLERSIGRTGKLALKPLLLLSKRDLWQLYVLRA